MQYSNTTWNRDGSVAGRQVTHDGASIVFLHATENESRFVTPDGQRAYQEQHEWQPFEQAGLPEASDLAKAVELFSERAERAFSLRVRVHEFLPQESRVTPNGMFAYSFILHADGTPVMEIATFEDVLRNLIRLVDLPRLLLNTTPVLFPGVSKTRQSRVLVRSFQGSTHRPLVVTDPLRAAPANAVASHVDWEASFAGAAHPAFVPALAEYARTLSAEEQVAFNGFLDEHGFSRSRVHLEAIVG